MQIRKRHLYQGAALAQIAEHKSFKAINKLATNGPGRSSFLINVDIGVYLKYAVKPNGNDEYPFTFKKANLDEVEEVAAKLSKTFIALVCVKARHVCCLTVKQLRTLIQYRKVAKKADEESYTVMARVVDGKSFRVYVNFPGEKGTVAGKKLIVSRGRFPGVLFK